MFPHLLQNNSIQAVVANNPAAWYRYGIGLTDAGAGACSAWADQSGNGRNLTAAGSARPTIQADKSLLFDGVANAMATSGFTLNQPETVYILYRQVTFTVNDRIFDGLVLNSGALINNDGSTGLRLNAGTNQGVGATGGTLNTYCVNAVVLNGASSLCQLNNNSPVSVAGSIGAGNMGGFTIGANGTVIANFGNIQVKEAIVFAGAHSADTITRIIRYLASVGGIAV